MSYEFQSRLAGHMSSFLEHRKRMGREISDYQKHLKHFDRFCLQNYPDEISLTQNLAFAWCNDARGKGAGATKRACILRNLGRYLSLAGEQAYIMPQMFFPTPKPVPPYILTDNELENFFRATDGYRLYRNPLLEYTVPVIFRLQYSCGMRPQEVRNLRRIDFNFADKTIYIAEGKHRKDRKLAVDTNTMELCKKYDGIANTSITVRKYFFQSPLGGAYSNSWLSQTFHRCWKMSGNEDDRGVCVPYDLRHNYASRVLMRWLEEGKDLNTWLPYLSAYMGHDNFKATFYYISLLPERLADTVFTSLKGILPEVPYEKE